MKHQLHLFCEFILHPLKLNVAHFPTGTNPAKDVRTGFSCLLLVLDLVLMLLVWFLALMAGKKGRM